MSRPRSESDEGTTASTRPHGAHETSSNRPDDVFDYGVIGVATAIVALSFYLAARYLVAPGERGESHIKRTILEEES